MSSVVVFNGEHLASGSLLHFAKHCQAPLTMVEEYIMDKSDLEN